MNKVKVSVIIPTYQRPEMLRRAVNSVLLQTLREFELIVVDDSPADTGTKQLLSSFNDERIRFTKNSRIKGANGARNTGILNSAGNYLAFLDDDDVWTKNKLSQQYNALKESEKNIGGVWSDFLKKIGGEWKLFGSEFNLHIDDLSKKILLGNVYMCSGSNLMIKKSVINETGLFDESLLRYQDIDFVLRILKKYKLIHLNKTHARIFPGEQNNPVLLESAYRSFAIKFDEELKKMSNAEKQKFYSHKYYTFAQLFSQNGFVLKTLFYISKIFKYKIINPMTILRFIFLSLKNKITISTKSKRKIKYE